LIAVPAVTLAITLIAALVIALLAVLIAALIILLIAALFTTLIALLLSFARRRLWRLRCLHDPVIMFRVLKIVFSRHPVSRCGRVTRQGLIFFIDRRRSAPDFYFRSITVIASIWGIVKSPATAGTATSPSLGSVLSHSTVMSYLHN